MTQVVAKPNLRREKGFGGGCHTHISPQLSSKVPFSIFSFLLTTSHVPQSLLSTTLGSHIYKPPPPPPSCFSDRRDTVNSAAIVNDQNITKQPSGVAVYVDVSLLGYSKSLSSSGSVKLALYPSLGFGFARCLEATEG